MHAARSELCLSLSRLALLASIDEGRLALIEEGQLDESDLSDTELRVLANVLNRSVRFLTHGFDVAELSQPVVLAERSTGKHIQAEFNFDPTSCPVCGRLANGARCTRCGTFLE
jgi:hypothetical protein